MKSERLTEKQLPFVRSANNYDRDMVSNDTGLICPEPTLAKQEFAEECDINYIADRYGLTGELPQVLDLPRFGDFTGIFDFMGAQNAVVKARQQFMTLPAKARARFDNDPQKLLTFLEDPENRDEAIALGLVAKPEPRPLDPGDTQPPAPPAKPATSGKTDT